MSGIGLLAAVLASALLGVTTGFLAGLIPGLHMNNIAAVVVAYGGAAMAFFKALSEPLGSGEAALLVCCFIASAVVSHQFSEAIPSTYLGIPAGDSVSVLPAHRLARAGLGRIAVFASANGSMSGIILSAFAILPLCLIMGEPVGLYEHLAKAMFFIVLAFSIVLITSEGAGDARRSSRSARVKAIALGLMFFLGAGLLGTVVLRTNFYAIPVHDFFRIDQSFVPRAALLLPLFAGLFGIPTVVLGLGHNAGKYLQDFASPCPAAFRPSISDRIATVLGGTMVGWLPGLTAGSAATLCVRRSGEENAEDSVLDASRFIWLYSAISACGSVFAVGAFFVISRERSGSMEAISRFMQLGSGAQLTDVALPALALLLSMVLSAIVSYVLLLRLYSVIEKHRSLIASDAVALASLVFICSLSVALTGMRGCVVLLCAVSLGLLAPMLRVRRIQLMGSLLVPILLFYLLE